MRPGIIFTNSVPLNFNFAEYLEDIEVGWIILDKAINFPSSQHIEYTDLLELSRDGDSKPLAENILNKLIKNMSTN